MIRNDSCGPCGPFDVEEFPITARESLNIGAVPAVALVSLSGSVANEQKGQKLTGVV